MEQQPIEGAESTRPHKTWFIQRGDGYIFAAREQEAWDLMKNRTNWMRKDFQIIGTSDGKTYHRIMQEGKNQLPRLNAEFQALQAEKGEYLATEHRLKYTDLLDDTDDRLVRVRSFIKDLQKRIEAKSLEIQRITLDLDKMAFEAELEVARGNIEQPGNQDIMTPGGRRDEIIRNMPR